MKHAVLTVFILFGLIDIVDARTRVPDYGVSVTSNGSWVVLSTEDTLDEAIETLDREIGSASDVADAAVADALAVSGRVTTVEIDLSALETNLGVVSGRVDTAEANITTNAGDIVINAAGISSNSLIGSSFGMLKHIDVTSGAADVWHEISYDEYIEDLDTSGCNTNTGRFTPPYNGSYLFAANVVVQDSGTAYDWIVRFATNGYLSGVYSPAIRYETELGLGGDSGTAVWNLTTNDYVSVHAKHVTAPLSASVNIQSLRLTATYLGE